MSTITTIQTLASDVRSQFIRKTRENGESFWTRESHVEDWIFHLCKDAHGSMLPDDWKYQFILDSLDALADHDHPDDARESLEADIYTSELTSWLSSHVERPGYVDEAMADHGPHTLGIIEQIQLGQLREKEEVFDSVLASLQTQLDELEEEE